MVPYRSRIALRIAWWRPLIDPRPGEFARSIPSLGAKNSGRKIDLAHSPGLGSMNGCNQAIRVAISVLMVYYVDFHFLENETTFWKMGKLFGKWENFLENGRTFF